MNQEILKALKGSIVKWEKIVAGTDKDDGVINCPLCILFYHINECNGCPVKKLDGVGGCLNTPYTPWDNHHYIIHKSKLPQKIECKICERHAKAEVEFLKSLLPGG